MRVVLLNQYYAPDDAATAQMLADLGQGLVQAGHEVEAVCSCRSYSDPSRRYALRERLDGVRVSRSWMTGFGRGTRVGRLIDYATFLLTAAFLMLFRRKPDVVVGLSTPPLVAALGWLVARLRGARSVYWVMDVYPELAFTLGVLRRDSVSGRLFAKLSGFVLRRSDEVVALGQTMAAKLVAAGATDVRVIHNWADGDSIRPVAPADHPLRRSWGWSGRVVVLYSGNMGLAHGFDEVLDAAQMLQDRPDVLFAFVGGGPRRGEVEAEVRRRGLSNVEFRPYVPREQLGQSLTAGDVHLVTLRPEVAGLLVPSKIYGILAAGRPTIYVGPDAGEIADIIKSGRCGMRVSCGDAPALVRAVRRYADEPSEREEDGRRARRIFDERYTRDRGLRDFARVIR